MYVLRPCKQGWFECRYIRTSNHVSNPTKMVESLKSLRHRHAMALTREEICFCLHRFLSLSCVNDLSTLA